MRCFVSNTFHQSFVLCSGLTEHDGVQHKASGQGKMPSPHSEDELWQPPTPPHPSGPTQDYNDSTHLGII